MKAVVAVAAGLALVAPSALMALLCAFMAPAVLFGQNDPCPGTDQANTSTASLGGLAVMSFNIKYSSWDPAADGLGAHSAELAWTARSQTVLALISSMAPDVVGFQEVNADQHKLLQAAMDDYAWVGTDTVTPIAYNADRFDKLDSGWTKILDEHDPHSTHNRWVRWAKLRDTADNSVFVAANIHNENGRDNDSARKAALEVALDALDAANPKNLPIVLTGDFNADTGADSAKLLYDGGWEPAHETAPISIVPWDGLSTYNGWGDQLDGSFRLGALRKGMTMDMVWTGHGAAAMAWQIVIPA
ncbi:MAG: endonuclease/exonuclease/phosphatase family protein, partial [Propionibacteriaceae bacterium]|nr:endonuclease/exonuclease/phosphatase family protein [Propionibacteriaceae bacterium]